MARVFRLVGIMDDGIIEVDYFFISRNLNYQLHVLLVGSSDSHHQVVAADWLGKGNGDDFEMLLQRKHSTGEGCRATKGNAWRKWKHVSQSISSSQMNK